MSRYDIILISAHIFPMELFHSIRIKLHASPIEIYAHACSLASRESCNSTTRPSPIYEIGAEKKIRNEQG
jgi:hypothetical protein